MGFFSKFRKKTVELPVTIKSGTRIVSGDTGIEYLFDGEHWKALTPSTVGSSGNLPNRNVSYSSPFSSVGTQRTNVYTSNDDSAFLVGMAAGSSDYYDTSSQSHHSPGSYGSSSTSSWSDSSSSCDSSSSSCD